MYNYYIDYLDNPDFTDNGLVQIDTTFKSDDGEQINGDMRIGLTTHNDIIFQVFPLSNISKGDDFKPISYELQDISNSSISKSDEKYQIKNEELQIVIYNKQIELTKNDTTIKIELEPTNDLKNNQCTRGVGFRAQKFNNYARKVDQTSIDIKMDSEERIYGGGERFKRINHTESDVKVQVTQGSGTKSDKTYKSVPRFVSDRGYGYSINTYNTVTGDFGVQSSEITEITSRDSSIEVLFTIGDSVKDCLSQLYKYESENNNPPIWSYGFWTSRNTYESWDEAMSIAKEYRDRNILCDVIHLDPSWLGSFDDYSFSWSEEFKDAEEHINKLHDMGFKISIWTYPYVPISSSMYKETDKSYFVDSSNGNKFIFNDIGKLALVDFTNPDAFEWWSNQLSEVISDGVDVIKADFGEYVSEDTVFYNGRTGKEMRNAYPDIYQEACVSAFRKANREPLLWSRSGWLNQNKNSIHWNGDAESDWNGYRTSIKSGLNASMSSYNYWSSDVGGYKKSPSDDLYGEWMKFSAIGSSHIRAHGVSPREPWEFPDSYDDSKTVLQERYKLIPYIYSYGQIAEEKGLPIMRPEILCVDDRSYYKENTQYFVGDHLLVAPYMTPDKSRNVYLPDDSKWISYWNDDEYAGGQEVTIDYSDCIIPVFVRKGATIPVHANKIQSISNKHDTNIRVYGNPDSNIKTPYYNGEELFDLISKPNGDINLVGGSLKDEFNNIIR